MHAQFTVAAGRIRRRAPASSRLTATVQPPASPAADSRDDAPAGRPAQRRTRAVTEDQHPAAGGPAPEEGPEAAPETDAASTSPLPTEEAGSAPAGSEIGRS